MQAVINGGGVKIVRASFKVCGVPHLSDISPWNFRSKIENFFFCLIRSSWTLHKTSADAAAIATIYILADYQIGQLGPQ